MWKQCDEATQTSGHTTTTGTWSEYTNEHAKHSSHRMPTPVRYPLTIWITSDEQYCTGTTTTMKTSRKNTRALTSTSSAECSKHGVDRRNMVQAKARRGSVHTATTTASRHAEANANNEDVNTVQANAPAPREDTSENNLSSTSIQRSNYHRLVDQRRTLLETRPCSAQNQHVYTTADARRSSYNRH